MTAGGPLWRAWEVCRLLDESDEERGQAEVARAVALTEPTLEDLERDRRAMRSR